MPKIAIIGNSAAGFSCCDTLVRNSRDNEITVISEEGGSPYNRNLLLGYLSGSVEEKALYLCGDDYYSVNHVNFIKGNKVALVEAKKGRLILKDNARLNYDYLVVATGAKPGLPDIPGNAKDGVFVFYTLDELRKILQRLAISDAAAIIGEPMLCASLAAAPVFRDKEVKIISRARPGSFSPGARQEWIENSQLAEIIGEGAQLQAIKLDSGKVIAVSLAVFATAHSPASELLKSADIKTEEGYILVNDDMTTNLENVFAAGSVCRRNNSSVAAKTWEDALSEGVLAANSLMKELQRRNDLCQQTS